MSTNQNDLITIYFQVGKDPVLDQLRVWAPRKASLDQLGAWAPIDPALSAVVQDSFKLMLATTERMARRLSLTPAEARVLLEVVDDDRIDPAASENFVADLGYAIWEKEHKALELNGKTLLWRVQALHPSELAALIMTLKAARRIERSQRSGLPYEAGDVNRLGVKAVTHGLNEFYAQGQLEALRTLGLITATTPIP